MSKLKNKSKNKLTNKQEMFCQEYLVDLNATQSAIRAGYKEKAAQRMGSENLSKPLVSQRISELKAKRVDSVKLDAKYVLNRLHQIDCLDVIDIINKDGSMKPIHEWPKEWRISISGLDVQEMISGEMEAIVKKIKWPDKLRNLELLGKHVDIGAWEKEIEIVNNTQNIMPVPSADNIDDWEAAAQAQQESILSQD